MSVQEFLVHCGVGILGLDLADRLPGVIVQDEIEVRAGIDPM